MFVLRTLPRRPLAILWQSRTFCAGQTRLLPAPAKQSAKEAKEVTSEAAAEQPKALTSSCPEGTVLEGIQWLKGQPPMRALPDEAYPEWLWTILEPKVYEDKAKAEKVQLRKINRQRIREQNFMKSQ